LNQDNSFARHHHCGPEEQKYDKSADKNRQTLNFQDPPSCRSINRAPDADYHLSPAMRPTMLYINDDLAKWCSFQTNTACAEGSGGKIDAVL
jgi:hypothetical protein